MVATMAGAADADMGLKAVASDVANNTAVTNVVARISRFRPMIAFRTIPPFSQPVWLLSQ